MTAPKTINEQPETTAKSPHKRFEDLASKVVNVPKATVDEREREWQSRPKKPRAKPNA